MTIYWAIIFGLLGASFGSFINVCVDRLPANKSLNYPPSHCDSCQRRLSALDLVPVFSYIFLRGRCRYCGAKIPLRVLLVELGCGLCLALLFWSKGLTLEFGIIAFYSFIFITIGLIDLQTKLILNKIVYPTLVIALILDGVLPRLSSTPVIQRDFINSLVGAGVGFGVLLIPVLVTMGRGMGLGDVKMAALIGLATGFGEVLVAVLGGIILGGVVAVLLLALRIKKRKEAIPFGPFLSIAAIVTLLWGTSILHWYLGIYQF